MVVDCEAIRSGNHECIRRLYILGKDGFTSLERDFRPCVDFEELCEKDRRSFRYCRKHIHHLKYYPAYSSPRCIDSMDIVKRFITENNINLLLYKGGVIERKLAEKLNISSYNIERIGAPKVNSHDPEVEVNAHWNFLLRTGCILELN